MNPETKIENKANRLIYEHLGIVSIKLNPSGKNGYPDRLYWIPTGRPLLIEYKCPGVDLEPLQQFTIDQLNEIGYNVQVHDNEIDAFESAIRAVETTRLSKEGREILARARRVCSLLRSRAGEDVNHLSCNKNFKKEKDT